MGASADIWHGTVNGYTNHACRCADCRAAATSYMRAWRKRASGKPSPSHGTLNGYTNYRCRCQQCRDAWRRHHRHQRQGLSS